MLSMPFAVSMLAAIFMLATCLAADIGSAFAQPDKVRLATFGTSLTAAGQWQRALRLELQRCWGREVAVLNAASSGKDSTWGVKNAAAATESRPDIVIVEFVMNDARLKGGVDLETSRHQTKEIIAKIKAAQPNAKVFLMITHMVRGNKMAGRLHLADYYQMYRDIAAEGLAGVIDPREAWSKIPDEDIPDGVHPTPAAHRAVTVPAIVRTLAPDCR